MGITSKQRGTSFNAGSFIDGTRVYANDGAIGTASQLAVLTKAGVGAYTLAAPPRDGLNLRIVNRTANAHVITATGLVDDGTSGTSKNTLTFAAFPGASVELESFGGKWNVLSKNAVT